MLSKNKYLGVRAEHRGRLCGVGAGRAAPRDLGLGLPGPCWGAPLASVFPPGFPSLQPWKLVCVLALPPCWRVFKRTDANWLVLCFSLVFILLLVGKTEENQRPRYPPADLGTVYLIDLRPFYIWKVVLERKLLFPKWTLSSAGNDTLDLAFTKEKKLTWYRREGGWVFSPLRWCCEKPHVSFSNRRLSFMTWVNLQSCSKWWRVDLVNAKTVWVLAFFFFILYITRKIMFSNIALGL